MKDQKIETFTQILKEVEVDPRPEAWNRLEQKMEHQRVQTKKVWLPYGVAASLAISIICLGWLMYDEFASPQEVNVSEEVLPIINQSQVNDSTYQQQNTSENRMTDSINTD